MSELESVAIEVQLFYPASDLSLKTRCNLIWFVDRPVKRVADESSHGYNDDAGETASEYAASLQRSSQPDRRRVCRAGVYGSQQT